MKRVVLLASLVLGGIVSAQNSNEELKKQLKERREQTDLEFDFYAQKKLSQIISQDKTSKIERDSITTNLENERSRIAFFFEGRPYFLKEFDNDQITNANVDYIQEGNINGLNGNFNGEGIRVAVFDGGRALETHPTFGNSDRINNKESDAVAYSTHATGVTGMIGGISRPLYYNSTGEYAGDAKGIMPLATFDNYSFRTTTLNGENEAKSVHEKIIVAEPNLSNHSYGTVLGWQIEGTTLADASWDFYGNYNPTTGEAQTLEGVYLWNDRDYDNIVYNNPSAIIVKSAGNSFGDGPLLSRVTKKRYQSGNTWVEFTDDNIVPQNNCGNGYDCIGHGSVAKNIIVVGATEKITTNNGRYTQAGDVVKASYSSAGPRDDGAIKPDIAGVGSDILHATTTGWSFGDGTSYSAPQITGIIGLWTEINKSLFNQEFNAASAKNLLIHTAQEAGNIGPDVWYGWGFADAKAGAELLVQKSNNEVIFEDKTLQNNSIDKIFVETDGKQPLKISISWIDPSFKDMPNNYTEAHNNRTSRLINDLDLRITNIKTGEVFYPWKLDINNPMASATKGDNLVDNVEQVLIETPEEGTYKIEVSHKGTLVNNNGEATNNQKYSIIATGYTRITSEKEYYDNYHAPLLVYPTLLTGNENEVKIDNPNKNIDSVSVYDMTGRLLKSEKVSNLPHSLNFSNLPKGIYVIDIQLNNSKETITRKVLKR